MFKAEKSIVPVHIKAKPWFPKPADPPWPLTPTEYQSSTETMIKAEKAIGPIKIKAKKSEV